MRISLSVIFVGSILMTLALPASAQTVGGGLLRQYELFGETWYDRMGYSVASAGDVNCDGVDDIIVGAIGVQVGGVDRGAAFVYSGADGSELHRFDGINASGNFGFSVSGAGDVDGDGYDDVIIGAPYVNSMTRTNEGRAYVYSGFDGHKLHRFDGANSEDRLGFAVSGAGDINGDGLADLLVSSLWFDEGHLTNSGAVDIFSGADGSLLRHFPGGSPEDYFGYSVSAAGDVDADGVPDVIIGAANTNTSGKSDAGRAYVYSGASGRKLHRMDGENSFDLYGFSVSGVGDIDFDGYDDFLVGALLADPSGLADAGSAYLYSGQSGALIHRFDGAEPGDYFGGSVGGGHDIDGDGVNDIVVGASGADPNGIPVAGSAFALSGASFTEIYRFDGYGENDFLGHSVASVADINDDGFAEFIVGAHLAENGGREDAGWFGVMGYHPYITCNRTEISAASGGRVKFLLQFPSQYAGQVYKLLGSATGTGPTSVLGVDVPLTDGDFIWNMLADPSPPRAFDDPIGTLNAAGEAVSTLDLPPGAADSFVGTTVYFAAILLAPPLEGLLSTACVAIDVIP